MLLSWDCSTVQYKPQRRAHIIHVCHKKRYAAQACLMIECAQRPKPRQQYEFSASLDRRLMQHALFQLDFGFVWHPGSQLPTWRSPVNVGQHQRRSIAAPCPTIPSMFLDLTHGLPKYTQPEQRTDHKRNSLAFSRKLPHSMQQPLFACEQPPIINQFE